MKLVKLLKQNNMRRLLTKIINGDIEKTPLVKQFLKENEEKDVELKKTSKSVSDELRGWYFGAILPFLRPLTHEWEKLTTEQLHEIMKKEFNYFEAYSVKNKRVERYGQPIANGDCEAGDMVKFIDRIADWVRENYGVEFPDPEQYLKWKNSAPLKGENYNAIKPL